MKAKVEKITPDKARELLKMNKSNRRLDRQRVKSYADQMKRGQWALTHQGISISPKKINDGQHRLTAIYESGVTVEMWVFYEENEDNFKRIDTGKVRSYSDIFTIEGIKNANNVASGVSKYLKLRNGLKDLNDALYRGKISNIDVLEEYQTDPPFFQMINNHAINFYGAARFFSGSDICGYMCFLIKAKKHEESIVIDFFSQLFGHTMTANNNIHLLRNTLIQDSHMILKMQRNHKIQLLTKTWNNYIKGNDIKMLKYDQEKENELKFA